MTQHKTGDVAAYIVELFQRAPAQDRTLGSLDRAVEQKFPSLSTHQYNDAQEMAAAALKASGQLNPDN
jgi:hypothetical protein